MESKTAHSLCPNRSEAGFTLLEVIIAMAIMVLALAAILSVESGSINASIRARQANIATMLARNAMIETEYKIEGKSFDEVKKEEGGNYDAPYQDYRWKTVVKEIEFPKLSFGSNAGGGGQDMIDLMAKLISNYLSKAIREVTVTIFWKKGGGEQSFSVTTYWVDLNHEFSFSE